MLFSILLIITLGLILGSFTSALTFRLPRQREWLLAEINEEKRGYNSSFLNGLRTRSRCTTCHHILGWRDLIPLLSYALSRGRCRYCDTRISIEYPLLEMGASILCLWIFMQYDFTHNFWILMAIVPAIMASTIIDLKYLILPNELTVYLGIVAMLNCRSKKKEAKKNAT